MRAVVAGHSLGDIHPVRGGIVYNLATNSKLLKLRAIEAGAVRSEFGAMSALLAPTSNPRANRDAARGRIVPSPIQHPGQLCESGTKRNRRAIELAKEGRQARGPAAGLGAVHAADAAPAEAMRCVS